MNRAADHDTEQGTQSALIGQSYQTATDAMRARSYEAQRESIGRLYSLGRDLLADIHATRTAAFLCEDPVARDGMRRREVLMMADFEYTFGPLRSVGADVSTSRIERAYAALKSMMGRA